MKRKIKSFSKLLKCLIATILIAASTVSAAWAADGPSTAPVTPKQDTGPGTAYRPVDSNFVVVLDPGHGMVNGSYSGCSYTLNGVRYVEDEIVMRITAYTKQYLEQYPNVTVYTTKQSVTQRPTLQDRVYFAATMGADLFVSQHVDAAGATGSTTTATGVESMVPRTGRYANDLAQQSQTAAATILNHLSALGLKNRGFVLRDSENGSTYPDGSHADYYGIAAHSQTYGVRGFIIEHGFMNNLDDLSRFLTTEENYRAFGEANAKGIMEYLNKAGKAAPPTIDIGNVSSIPSNNEPGIIRIPEIKSGPGYRN